MNQFFFVLFSCLKFAVEISKGTVQIVFQLSLNSTEIREWNSELFKLQPRVVLLSFFLISTKLFAFFVQINRTFHENTETNPFLRELDAYLAKGSLQIGNTTPEDNFKRT